MKLIIPPILCLCFALSALPSLQAATPVTASDKKFVMKAAQGGMTEVELGKQASEKGVSSDVKDFGSMMVTDHGKANSELAAIANSKGITVPDKLNAKHQATVDKMSGLSGKEFDKEYVDAMVKGHQETLALFKSEESSTKDPELKDFATKTAETVQMHLTKVEQIQKTMK